MDKTIKICGEDYGVIKRYAEKKHLPIWYIVKQAVKRYFADKKKG